MLLKMIHKYTTQGLIAVLLFDDIYIFIEIYHLLRVNDRAMYQISGISFCF